MKQLLMLALQANACSRLVVSNTFILQPDKTYIVSLLPPISYSFTGAARINDHSARLTLSDQELAIKQCGLQGDYQITLFAESDPATELQVILGTSYKLLSHENDQQTSQKYKPIIEFMPPVIIQNRPVYIEMVEQSFDYRKPAFCLFMTQDLEIEVIGLIS
jgi:hypothetical protein